MTPPPAPDTVPLALAEPESADAHDAMTLSSLPEVVRTVYDFMPATLAGFVAGVGVVTLLFWKLTPAWVLAPWMGAFAVMALARWLVAQRFKRADPQSRADWLRWRLYSNLGAMSAGLLWGLTGVIFYGRGNPAQQTPYQWVLILKPGGMFSNCIFPIVRV